MQFWLKPFFLLVSIPRPEGQGDWSRVVSNNVLMSAIIIYHNGECSKCRGALELLQERGIPHEVRWYLAEPLSRMELAVLVTKLNMKPSELVRTSEELYTDNYAGKDLSEEEWVTILAEHPILMQRPIVEVGDKAVVARPAERMFEIIPANI